MPSSLGSWSIVAIREAGLGCLNECIVLIASYLYTCGHAVYEGNTTVLLFYSEVRSHTITVHSYHTDNINDVAPHTNVGQMLFQSKEN